MARTALLLAAVLFASPAAAQPALPEIEEVEPGPLRQHCRRLLQALESLPGSLPSEATRAMAALLRQDPKDGAALAAEVQKLLDPHCLVGVTINPESRVKAVRGAAPAELRLGRATVVLIKIHNDAGVTHPLTVTGPQLVAEKPAEEGQWLEATVLAHPPLTKGLGGHRLEYVLLRLTPREAGKREATLKFDVGQGTQDLGFRAEVPVLFQVKEK